MAKAMTLEQLLANTDDVTLISMLEELRTQIIPATSCTRAFIRKVNRMIDQGKLCINASTHRRVYLPTLAKALHKELARRYADTVLGRRCATQSDDSCEQLAFGLVNTQQQDNLEDNDK